MKARRGRKQQAREVLNGQLICFSRNGDIWEKKFPGKGDLQDTPLK